MCVCVFFYFQRELKSVVLKKNIYISQEWGITQCKMFTVWLSSTIWNYREDFSHLHYVFFRFMIKASLLNRPNSWIFSQASPGYRTFSHSFLLYIQLQSKYSMSLFIHHAVSYFIQWSVDEMIIKWIKAFTHCKLVSWTLIVKHENESSLSWLCCR